MGSFMSKNAFYNFIFVWSTVFMFVLISTFALIIVYPYAFLFRNEHFTHSVDFEIEVVRTSFRNLEKSVVNNVKKYWRE